MVKKFCIVLFCLGTLFRLQATSWIRVNQMGYLPRSVKVAVWLSTDTLKNKTFEVCHALTDRVVFSGQCQVFKGDNWGMKAAARLNFSSLETPGGYYVKVGDTHSPVFQIDADVYKGTADFVLNYMRQQRCGYNPYLKDSCHTHDGFIVDHPTRTGEKIDVTGGWHDASDYLQYLTTSANAIYQMMFAYKMNPGIYQDHYDAKGHKGSNGIADILDEARWGLEWMVKMNPDSGVMFNQIADDRDHRGYRLPNKDSVSYGNGLYRPVYFVTGKPQGLAKHKNRTTGVSSTAGKYCSSFAMGAVIFKDIDPAFADKLKGKAQDAFDFALTDLGETQTACNVSPYFYEENNYTDDLELAAWELFHVSGDQKYLKQADYWGQLEPVTPWMQKGTARHYQYYPFVNLGHAQQAILAGENSSRYNGFLKDGLEAIWQRAKEDPFLNGIPFIWCSNNLNAAAITQARLYYEATQDSSYMEMEAALRDWLFGCNPWGTTMVCGLPAGGDYPRYPHSAITFIMDETTYGGLVDGPVFRQIYEGLRGIHLMRDDMYAPFQHGKAVYHDDMGDYSTNEPTMDGTASLSYYLSSMEKEGLKQQVSSAKPYIDGQGAIIRVTPDEKNIYLVFSADEHGEGADYILDMLNKKKVKASFFLSGNYLREKENAKYIKRMVKQKHYVGPHSDKHLLYAPWEKRDSLLVSQKEFDEDIKANYRELAGFNVKPEEARWFLPPYEWHNRAVTNWSKNRGITLVNFTSGVGTNADYTIPSMNNYKTSDELLKRMAAYEANHENGLNGAIVLIHLGTHPERKDKFYFKLNEIIDTFAEKGYRFKKFDNKEL